MLVAAQLVLSGTLAWAQPVKTAQVSVVQALLSLQFNAGGAQAPPAQMSGPVHALLSLQAAALATCAQPVTALQLSLVQPFKSSQFSAAPGLQTLPLQASPTVQTLLSALQARPLAPAPLYWHAPLFTLQLSMVQGLLSLHTVSAPLTQAPALQTSATVQALPSLHAAELLTWMQPETASHASLVQVLPSSQFNGAPATQLVPLQTSGLVHTLLSALQAPPPLMPA